MAILTSVSHSLLFIHEVFLFFFCLVALDTSVTVFNSDVSTNKKVMILLYHKEQIEKEKKNGSRRVHQLENWFAAFPHGIERERESR